MKRQALLSAAAAAALLLSPGVVLAQSDAAGVEQAGKPNKPPPAPPAPLNNDAAWALINWTHTEANTAGNGAGVTVAVFDGLTYCLHAGLAGRCDNTLIDGGRYRFYDHHGTHVAGTIADSTFGIARQAVITNYAVFDDRRYVAGGSKLIDAWNAAQAEDAVVANMSFGCTGLALCFTAAEVARMGAANNELLFVKAAGNDGRTFVNESVGVSPDAASTALGRLILVGSIDLNSNISSFSNRPGSTCLLATGVATCTADNQWRERFIVAPGENIYSTLAGAGRYGHMSGTSMATPVVSGTAALIHSKWGYLAPEVVAEIILSTADNLGAAGTDDVYGRGRLNVYAALQPAAKANVENALGQTSNVNGASFTASATFGEPLLTVLGEVTAYDGFGRDFKLSEVDSFNARRSGGTSWATPGSRLASLGRQADWTAGFFAPASTPMAYTAFGPLGSTAAAGLSFDSSLRIGADLPTDGGTFNLRMTGSSDARADFAADAALRPLSFFASSELMNESAFAGFSRSLSPTSRIILFATGSAGTQVNPEAVAPLAGATGGFHEMLAETGFGVDQSVRRQMGVGASYWRQLDERTVAGLNVSAMAQRHAFYDLASDLDIFDEPTLVTNFGAGVSRTYGAWDLFASGEVSRVSGTSAPGPLAFTGATLTSGEVGVRRSNLLAAGDALSFSLTQAPTAVSGALALDYLERTEDGLGRQSARRDVALSDLTRQPLRLETGYSFRSRAGWSYGVAAGVDVDDHSDVIATGHFRRRF